MFFSIAIFNIVVMIIFNFSSIRVVNADKNDNKFGFCPPGAIVNLANAVEYNSGFITENGLFFPRNLVGTENGVLRGCICDVKPCITVCPTSAKNDETENSETIPKSKEEDENYVDYAAIPNVYDKNLKLVDYANDDEKTLSYKNRFHVLIWRPCDKEDSYALDPEYYPDSDEYFLLEDGSMYLPQAFGSKFRNFKEYCLQNQGHNSPYNPRLCASPYESIDKAIYIGGLLAIPFLIATVIVYSVLPQLNNIHGRTFRYYLCCMIVTCVTVAINGITTVDSDAGPFCLSLGFTIYFSFLASFLWLNVICFDMWRTFGGSGSFWITNAQSDRKKFIGYSIYVWGITSIMTAICVAMEFSPNISNYSMIPGFRLGSCWFDSKSTEALYVHGPIAVTTVCNIWMFISTAVKLYVQKKQTERDLNTGGSRRHDDNEPQFKLFLKLFVAMGITLSTAQIIFGLWERPNRLGLFADLVFAPQSISIFVIMVCKRNILTALKERFKIG